MPVDMSVIDINYAAVVVAAAVEMVIGMLWYSPALFGNMWMKEAGRTPADMEAGKKHMPKLMAMAAVGALVMSYVLAHVLDLIGVELVKDAVSTAFWIWLGFVATVHLHSVLWDGKSWKYFAINAGYSLVSLIVLSLILSQWV